MRLAASVSIACLAASQKHALRASTATSAPLKRQRSGFQTSGTGVRCGHDGREDGLRIMFCERKLPSHFPDWVHSVE